MHLALLLLIAFLLPATTGGAWAQQEGERPTILFLNSYHQGYAWSDAVLEGYTRRLEADGTRVDLRIEYLDTKRHTSPNVRARQLNLLTTKYAAVDVDLVVVSDDAAYNFAREHLGTLLPYRDDSFSGLVFCGVNGDPGHTTEPQTTELHNSGGKYREGFDLPIEQVRGVLEVPDVIDTLVAAARLLPNHDRVAVVGDESLTSHAIETQIRSAKHDLPPDYAKRLHFEYHRLPIRPAPNNPETGTSQGGSLEEMRTRLAAMPPGTFVYLIPFFAPAGSPVGDTSSFLDPGGVMQQLSRGVDHPFVSGWSFYLNHGMLGGYLLNGREQGEQAATQSLILLGRLPRTVEDAVAIPQAEPIFSHEQMQRFGVLETNLPPDARIHGAPSPFYEVSKELFWTIATSLAILACALFFLAVNVVKRRTAQRQISEQLAFRQKLIDTIPQLVCWKDTKQCYLGANRTFLEFFGAEPDHEILDAEYTGPEVPTAPRRGDDFATWAGEVDRQVIERGRGVHRKRIRVARPGGEAVWLEMTKVPLHDARGQIIGTLSTSDNITREMLLERQLLRSQKMEAIAALAGGISHDFNNILTAIMNSSELALDEAVSEAQRDDIRRVVRASRRGKELVERILSFSRPSQEGFVSADPAEIVREALGFIAPSLPASIEVHCLVDDAPRRAVLNPVQFHQVVMNLCTNAYQAMRANGSGGGALEVTLGTEQLDADEAAILEMAPGTVLRLGVADTGPGMDGATIDRIFDPFFTTKEAAVGTGIGLSVVLGIVRNHGGGVRVTSSPGEGARFDVYLPLGEVGESPVEPDRPRHGCRPLRILFVEDDADQLATIPRVLERAGHTVRAVDTPLAARALLTREAEVPHHETNFDIMVTDFDMPGMDGVQLAHEAARLVPHLPVVMISGRREAHSGARDVDTIRLCLSKPFTPDELCDALRHAVPDHQRT